MKTERLEAGLTGWRAKLADVVEKPLAKRTPLTVAQIRRILGAVFILKSALYLGKTARRAAKKH